MIGPHKSTMKKDKEKLYETLGELLYAVAMADGVIQPTEIERLNEIVQHHPWGSSIKWSFDYEDQKRRNLDEVYKDVINFCHDYGPTPEYDEFLELVALVADASDGIDHHEELVISNFGKNLVERFKDDLDKGVNRYQ